MQSIMVSTKPRTWSTILTRIFLKEWESITLHGMPHKVLDTASTLSSRRPWKSLSRLSFRSYTAKWISCSQQDSLLKKPMTQERHSILAKSSFGSQNHAHGKGMFMISKRRLPMKAELNLLSFRTAEVCSEFKLCQRVHLLSKTEFQFAKLTEVLEMRNWMQQLAYLIASSFMLLDSSVEHGRKNLPSKWLRHHWLNMQLKTLSMVETKKCSLDYPGL